MEVRRAGDRFVTRSEGRTTWHSFSFGAHYDPAEVGFGALVAHNDEHLPPGTGYDDHLHRDVEIVSAVLEGSLRHTSEVGDAVLVPGDVQRLSAGDGVRHREWSPVEHPSSGPAPVTRFVQTWLRPRSTGGRPSYTVVRGALSTAGLAVIETGAQADAVLRAGTVPAGAMAHLPPPGAGAHHLFVAVGEVSARVTAPVTGGSSVTVSAGDAVRVRGESVEVVASTTATLVVWTTSTI